MLIKPSSALRNDYGTISTLARDTAEPVYITKNGEGDMVLMSIEAFEAREDTLARRSALLDAERRALSGESGFTVDEARARMERLVSLADEQA